MCCDDNSLKWNEMTFQAICTYLILYPTRLGYYFATTSIIWITIIDIFNALVHKFTWNFIWDLLGLLIVFVNILPLYYLLKLMKTKQIGELNSVFRTVFLLTISLPWILVAYAHIRENEFLQFLPISSPRILFIVEAARIGTWTLICAFFGFKLKLVKRKPNTGDNFSYVRVDVSPDVCGDGDSSNDSANGPHNVTPIDSLNSLLDNSSKEDTIALCIDKLNLESASQF